MVSEELVHGWHWLFFLGKAKTRQATKSRPEQHGMGIRALLSRALEFFDPDQRLYRISIVDDCPVLLSIFSLYHASDVEMLIINGEDLVVDLIS